MDETTGGIERLKAERDELEGQVERLENGPPRRRHIARIVSTILVVLAVLVLAAAVPGTWARRTLLDTDRYVATVTPLASDPAVQEYVARTVTQQVFTALDVEQRLSAALQEPCWPCTSCSSVDSRPLPRSALTTICRSIRLAAPTRADVTRQQPWVVLAPSRGG